jgi:hypothetical protein
LWFKIGIRIEIAIENRCQTNVAEPISIPIQIAVSNSAGTRKLNYKITALRADGIKTNDTPFANGNQTKSAASFYSKKLGGNSDHARKRPE